MITVQDHWRTARWQIARLIIFVDLIMAIVPGFGIYRVVTGKPSMLTDDAVLLAAWAVASVPWAASLVLAIRVFKAGERTSGWRTTAWASALFLAAVLLIGITSAIRDNH
jgi:hypothetical protein